MNKATKREQAVWDATFAAAFVAGAEAYRGPNGRGWFADWAETEWEGCGELAQVTADAALKAYRKQRKP